MAINRISAPSGTPAAIGDWSAVVAQLASLVLDRERPIRVSGSNVTKGAFFNIGGVLYQADADTAISGSACDYVKITPSGATAAAAFVANLTGVSWNSTYKGYYDGSGNLYVFDELKAYPNTITALKSELGAVVASRMIDTIVKDRRCVYESFASGAFSVTVPTGPGYKYAAVIAIGGGAGGGGGGSTSNIWPGGGGGAGALYMGYRKVADGDVLSFTVGAKGVGGGQGGNGTDGGGTTVGGLTVGRGVHGICGGAAPGAGGAGGAVSGSDAAYTLIESSAGGAGGNGYASASSGGSGSGGAIHATVGNNGGSGAGGVAVEYETKDSSLRVISHGGAGVITAGVSAELGLVGGGGGGGSRSSASLASFGGDGAIGKVIVVLY